jgi:type I restriction enzyme S subunit
MKLTKLSELLDISIGRTPSRSEPDYWGKGYPWVSIRDLSSKTVVETKEQITDQAVSEVRCKLVPKGTLLFSFKLTIGKMAFAGCDLYTNEAIAAFSIKDKKKLHPDFLYYALQAATYGGSNQAVMGKTLNSKSLADIAIPVPSLEDQIRIAHLLGKVEALITQRKQHLQQLDDLLKSVFLEMFGDPMRNEKGWDLYPLSQKCKKITDGTHDTPDRLTNGVPFITGKHIRPYSVDYLGCDFVSSEDHSSIYSRCDPKYGDILYTNIGVNLGTAAMNNVHYEFSMKNVALLKPSSELNSRFLEHYLNFEKIKAKIISDLSSGGAQKFLGLGQIKKILVITPPKQLQDNFAEIVEKVENIKSNYYRGLTDLESFYGSLSQQAFKGKLDLQKPPFEDRD